jgi:hypothetical protein
MYAGEYDACDVTLSVYPHRASLKNMPGHGGIFFKLARCEYTLRVTSQASSLIISTRLLQVVQAVRTQLVVRLATTSEIFESVVPSLSVHALRS